MGFQIVPESFLVITAGIKRKQCLQFCYETACLIHLMFGIKARFRKNVPKDKITAIRQ